MSLALSAESRSSHGTAAGFADESVAHWNCLIQAAPLLLCVLDADGLIREASQALLRRVGQPESVVVGARPGDFLTPDSALDLQRFCGPDGSLGSLREHPCEWRHRDGEVLSLRLTTLIQRDGRGRAARTVCVFDDRTEVLALARRLEQAGRSDPLTGVWHRACFTELMRVEINRAAHDDQPVCVLLIQAEHFRELNDACGHSVGDAALCSVAATLRRMLRIGDPIGRLSGASFAILMPGLALQDAHAQVERVRQALADLEISHSGYLRRIEARYALIELAHGDSAEAALARAEHAVSGRRRSGIARHV